MEKYHGDFRLLNMWVHCATMQYRITRRVGRATLVSRATPASEAEPLSWSEAPAHVLRESHHFVFSYGGMIMTATRCQLGDSTFEELVVLQATN